MVAEKTLPVWVIAIIVVMCSLLACAGLFRCLCIENRPRMPTTTVTVVSSEGNPQPLIIIVDRQLVPATNISRSEQYHTHPITYPVWNTPPNFRIDDSSTTKLPENTYYCRNDKQLVLSLQQCSAFTNDQIIWSELYFWTIFFFNKWYFNWNSWLCSFEWR